MKREPNTESPPENLRIHCKVGNVMKIVFDGMIGGSIDGDGANPGDGAGGEGEVPFLKSKRDETPLSVSNIVGKRSSR